MKKHSTTDYHHPNNQAPDKKALPIWEGFFYMRQELSVLMPVLAMHMLVSNFLSRCRAHVHHFDGKAQGFTA